MKHQPTGAPAVVHREPLTFRRVAALAGVKLLVLVAVAVPVLTALPYGVEMAPVDPGPPMSERDQARAVAVKAYGVSQGCRAAELYPPPDEQRSAVVVDVPGVIRLTSIDEGRAALAGNRPEPARGLRTERDQLEPTARRDVATRPPRATSTPRGGLDRSPTGRGSTVEHIMHGWHLSKEPALDEIIVTVDRHAVASRPLPRGYPTT